MTIPANGHIRNEIERYRYLAGQLRATFADLDDDTLRDTLEGLSDLPDMIQALVRSSLDDGTLIEALKSRIEDMQTRQQRLKERQERKRDSARWAMEAADIRKLEAAEFTLGLRQSPPRLEILDEALLPPDYLVTPAPKPDRSKLLLSLKSGTAIAGAALAEGGLHLAVRVR